MSWLEGDAVMDECANTAGMDCGYASSAQNDAYVAYEQQICELIYKFEPLVTSPKEEWQDYVRLLESLSQDVEGVRNALSFANSWLSKF